MKIEIEIEKSEEGLDQIIQAAVLFEENRYLEAVRTKNMTEHEMMHLTEDVKLWHSRMRKESLKLAAFSDKFLDEFATDNNRRFQDAYEMFSKVRSTIAGSRKMFKKFCMRMMKNPSNPNASRSVYDRSILSAHVVSRDLFGIQSYNDKVQTLYEEMKDFFTTLVLTLALCHRMIRDEKIIRQDAARCLDIYRKCRADILSSARLFAKTFDVKEKTASESELIERRKNAKSLQEWAQKNYHRMNKSEQMTLVAYEVISEGTRQGMSKDESLLWPDNPDMVKNVKNALALLDAMLPADKRNIDGYTLLKFIKWCKVSEKNERKLYEYIKANYSGTKHIVGWTQVFNVRKYYNDIPDEKLAEAFEKDLKNLQEEAA